MRKALHISASIALTAILFSGCATIKGFLPGTASSGKATPIKARTVDAPAAETPAIGTDNGQGGIWVSKMPVSEEISYPETIQNNETEEKEATPTLSRLQKRLIRTAKSKLGCRYGYSGKGPNVFDCSGFMMYVFGQEGIKLSPGSRQQYTEGRPLKKKDTLRPCDLVFFSGRKVSGTVGHVGMVLDYDSKTGEFTFIHAAVSTGIEIQKSTAEYYAKRYIGARRVLPDDSVADDTKADTDMDKEEAEIKPEEPEQEAIEEPAPEPEVWHTIKSGDTLSGIAKKYHTTVSSLCRLNGISTRTILKIGRKLRVK